MKRVRKHRSGLILLSTVVLAIAAAAGIASATTVRVGNLAITLSGAPSPNVLPKSEMAPISFHASASIATDDGSHVPPIGRSHLQVDKHIKIDTTGLPSCSPSQLQATSTAEAMKVCGSALVGKGTSTAEVEFPESAPFLAKGPLLIFNGPAGSGPYGYPEQIYYVHANVPVPTTFVVIGKLSADSGPYAYNISIDIPPIAGGSGSVTNVDFTINRKWTYQGRQHSYLNAECADGRFLAQVEFAFKDGTDLIGNVAKACRSKG
jgi:hypothetical protein